MEEMRKTYVATESPNRNGGASGGLRDQPATGRAEEASGPVRARGDRAFEMGSATEFAGGAIVATLAIIGLAGAAPLPLLAIACIAAGGVLVFASAVEAPRVRALTGRTRREMEGGVGVEAVLGAGAVVLGILALIGVAPSVLTSISAIAIGMALASSSVIPAHESAILADERTRRAGEGAAVVRAIVGLGAVALGILALVGVHRVSLTLVAFLVIGVGMLLTGSALLAGAGFTFTKHAHA
jgi:hypothetical protein